MEVENAAEVGAQAAWKTCNNLNTTLLPATVKLSAAEYRDYAECHDHGGDPEHNTWNRRHRGSGYPAENYYCVNASNALILQGPVSSPPTACSGGVAPGDYLQVGVTYLYAPLFPGNSVMSVLGVTSITKTSWLRMG